ncbi:MAG: ABC transporter permease [Gammaproteobacteria bacterium]|nr:ABC transporter permease [Gammaproteobacteria bacterium]MDE1983815.1 ABC transporter permease [Gammaproteobacteria bacterium]
MSALSQLVAVSLMNFRNLPRRLDSSLVAVVGFAGVVLVVVAILSIRAGFRSTLATTGSPDVAIVLRGGAGSEVNSVLGGNNSFTVGQAPGVAQDQSGPLVSPELLVQISLKKSGSSVQSNVSFRGVTADALKVHSRVHIVSGRMFSAGMNEVIVGAQAARLFQGVQLGDTLHTGRYDWKVVGIFDDGGGLHSSEIWTSLPVLQGAYQRGNSVSSMYAKLTSPSAFPTFQQSLEHNPQLNVSVQRESDYFAGQAQGMSLFIGIVGVIIAVLMGGGAVFGAVNTMYTAVSARTQEIAMLRALGFGRTPVLCSVLLEALLLGLVGGVCGGLIAYLLFNGFQATTFTTLTIIAFRFAVTPHLLEWGLAYALVMGLLGGILPAVRAVRLPIAASLRQS